MKENLPCEEGNPGLAEQEMKPGFLVSPRQLLLIEQAAAMEGKSIAADYFCNDPAVPGSRQATPENGIRTVSLAGGNRSFCPGSRRPKGACSSRSGEERSGSATLQDLRFYSITRRTLSSSPYPEECGCRFLIAEGWLKKPRIN